MTTTDPAPLILIQPQGPAIAFNAYGLTTHEIMATLRRCLIFVAAQHAGLLTVEAIIPPTAAAAPPRLATPAALALTMAPSTAPLNGHSQPHSNGADHATPAPAPAAAKPAQGQPDRKRPGPPKGTPNPRKGQPRRRKIDTDDPIEAQAIRDSW